MMNRLLILGLVWFLAGSCTGNPPVLDYSKPVSIREDILKDKIKGGWAGQTIGCTYGGPTEFKYKGGLINDWAPITWYDDYIYDT
ncbi:MAG: ADP-ribosylglycohydrolase family protein, partial [Bacteroidales bacterium]